MKGTSVSVSFNHTECTSPILLSEDALSVLGFTLVYFVECFVRELAIRVTECVIFFHCLILRRINSIDIIIWLEEHNLIVPDKVRTTLFC